YFRIGDDGVDLAVEPCDDLGGRARGGAEGGPPARLLARHRFRDRGHGRQRLRAFGGGERERTQFAGTDIFDRREDRDKRGPHLSAEQVRIEGAAIWHVLHLD